MGLADLTRDAVVAATQEYDALGSTAFLRNYGFRSARDYFLVYNGRRYDSKAIAGAAHKFARPDVGPLRASDFSGGELTVARELRRLGFEVEGPADTALPLPELMPGRVYTWDELAAAFRFKPSLFQVGGGMLPRPEFDSILLITHPGGARSFDYEDRWDGDTLIYTGRGKSGDQRLEGPNRDVAENRKRLLVLEAVEARRLRYLGEATCLDSWTARAADRTGQQRNVWKFRLGFDRKVTPAVATEGTNEARSVLRRSRPFSPTEPAARQISTATRRATPEEIAALQEKANKEHTRLVARLAEMLWAAGWTKVEEVPGAIDLWAVDPNGGGRILFEVKTLSDANDIHQCRAALAQLLEYRFFYGTEEDRLCVVLNRPIADRRRALLEKLGLAVVVLDGASAKSVGQLAHEWFGATPLSASGSPPATAV